MFLACSIIYVPLAPEYIKDDILCNSPNKLFLNNMLLFRNNMLGTYYAPIYPETNNTTLKG